MKNQFLIFVLVILPLGLTAQEQETYTYNETAAYGHMGRQSEVVKKTFTSRYHETKTIDVELFTWEKLDRVNDIKRAFGL